MIRGERIVAAFAGLRVLPRGRDATLDASRDHLLSVGPGGMVSVAGGKLTTHRRIALDALRHLPDKVRLSQRCAAPRCRSCGYSGSLSPSRRFDGGSSPATLRLGVRQAAHA